MKETSLKNQKASQLRSPNARHQVNPKLLLCGTTLVVPEFFSIHGRHYRNGKKLWSFDTGGYRELKVLGAQRGVLHVYSKQVGRGDGGQLLGFEPLTGTLMFRQDIETLTGSSRQPKAFLGDLWVLVASPEQKPQVLRLCGLTGRVKARTLLPVSLVRRLQLGNDTGKALLLDRLQRHLLVDQNAIYISQQLPGPGRPPFVVAVRHKGGQRWIWTGERGGRLEACGLHRAGIVVVEVRGSVASKFCVLALSNGAETSQQSMRGVVEIANWDRYLSPDHPPDQVLLAQEKGTLTLTCRSLTKDVPSFRYILPTRNLQLQETPVFGDNCLAIPVVTKRGDRRELWVIDLKRRRGALPKGRKHIRLAPAHIGFRLTSHGKYIVYQDSTSVHVLGKGVTVK